MRSLDEIDYPKDADEYWALAEANKDDLVTLIQRFHPYNGTVHSGFEITAHAAERMCAGVRESIAREVLESPTQSFERCLAEKDDHIVDILNHTWFGMPESTGVRCLPGFGVLCDLCSESYVLEQPEEMEDGK